MLHKPYAAKLQYKTSKCTEYSYNLRSRGENRIPQIEHRTVFGEKSIQKRGPEIWKEIPETIKSIVSPIFFKKKLKLNFLASSAST